MKIGIVGAGEVGSNLGKALAKAGHEIMYSSRNPQSAKMQALIAETGSGTRAGTVRETVAFGAVVAIAIGWQNDLEAVLTGVPDWSGKVLIDATNRFGPPPQNSLGSAAQDIAQLTGAPVMKAFNTMGAEHYLQPDFDNIQVTMFICGDDTAKETAQSLVSEVGFDVVDVGGLDQAHHLEALAALWVHLAFRAGYGRDIVFKLLHNS